MGNVDSSDMAVLIGKGDGTFQAAVNYPVGMYGQLLALGDFNGDGIPDLAVDGCQPTKPATFAIAALEGNGDGTFQPAVVNVMGETGCPVPLAFGDFNADGWDDLVFPDYSTYGTTVLQSEGNGKFVRRSETPTGGYFISDVITGDFNGDGKPDAVTVNNSVCQQHFAAGGCGRLPVLSATPFQVVRERAGGGRLQWRRPHRFSVASRGLVGKFDRRSRTGDALSFAVLFFVGRRRL